jgi:hypothetical protein
VEVAHAVPVTAFKNASDGSGLLLRYANRDEQISIDRLTLMYADLFKDEPRPAHWPWWTGGTSITRGSGRAFAARWSRWAHGSGRSLSSAGAVRAYLTWLARCTVRARRTRAASRSR